MNKFKYLLLAASLFASSAVFTSCDDGDDDNTANPAEEVVKASKKHDTAILLCTFGSTFKESIKTYDATLADFQNAFPDSIMNFFFTSVFIKLRYSSPGMMCKDCTATFL